jgi:hypothetical protein
MISLRSQQKRPRKHIAQPGAVLPTGVRVRVGEENRLPGLRPGEAGVVRKALTALSDHSPHYYVVEMDGVDHESVVVAADEIEPTC